MHDQSSRSLVGAVLQAVDGPALHVRDLPAATSGPWLWTGPAPRVPRPRPVRALRPDRRARDRAPVPVLDRDRALVARAAAHAAGRLRGLQPRLDGGGARVLAVPAGVVTDLHPGDVVVGVGAGAGTQAVRTAADLGQALTGRVRTLQVLPAGSGPGVAVAARGARRLRWATAAPHWVDGLEVLAAPAAGAGAGLALGLALVDRLDGGSLFAGRRVVALGALALDGSVGGAGDLDATGRAAAQARADLLLVPAADAGRAAQLAAVEGVRVVGVPDLTAAVRALTGDRRRPARPRPVVPA